MAHETRIGLLVGMGFIVCFAIILANRGGLDRVAPQMPYQVFGERAVQASGPAKPAGGRWGEPADDATMADPFPELPGPAGESGDVGPRNLPRKTNGDNPNSQRFIQRRRSLLPTREMAATDVNEASDDYAEADANEMAETIDTESAMAEGNGGPTDDSTMVADAEPDSAAPALPTVLAGFADQLEVVSPGGKAQTEPVFREDPTPIAPDPGPEESVAVHVIEKGDSLSRIAKRYYGTASKAVVDAILAANRSTLRSAHALLVGRTLKLPAIGDLRPANLADEGQPSGTEHPAAPNRGEPAVLLASQKTPTPVNAQQEAKTTAEKRGNQPEPWRWYTVKKGDLYSTIAQQQLGTSRRWKELAALNKDLCRDAKQLREGLQIRIPNETLADAR